MGQTPHVSSGWPPRSRPEGRHHNAHALMGFKIDQGGRTPIWSLSRAWPSLRRGCFFASRVWPRLMRCPFRGIPLAHEGNVPGGGDQTVHVRCSAHPGSCISMICLSTHPRPPPPGYCVTQGQTLARTSSFNYIAHPMTSYDAMDDDVEEDIPTLVIQVVYVIVRGVNRPPA